MKSLNQVELEDKAEEVLRTFLDEIPFLKSRLKRQPAEDDSHIDFIADLQVSGTPKRLLIECKSTGEPRFVRDAVLRLDRQRQDDPKAYAVFMAPYISPEAAALCAEENIGYIDFSGNCYFSTPPLFIHKEGHPNRYLGTTSPPVSVLTEIGTDSSHLAGPARSQEILAPRTSNQRVKFKLG